PSSPGNIRSRTMRSMRLSSSTRSSLRPSAMTENVEVIVAKISPDEPTDLNVVFHDKNMRRRIHRRLHAVIGAIDQTKFVSECFWICFRNERKQVWLGSASFC